MQTLAQRERTRRKAVRRRSRVKAVGCFGLCVTFAAMAALVAHGGVLLLLQVSLALIAAPFAWALLRRRGRSSRPDTLPSRRTRQIDPRLALEFRADDWTESDSPSP